MTKSVHQTIPEVRMSIAGVLTWLVPGPAICSSASGPAG